MKRKLSKSVADAAEPQAARYVIWDTELSGFGLRVTPAGAKSWVVKYRAGEGGRNAAVRWYALGGYPELKAPDARDAAGEALAKVKLGQDPAGDRTAKRREMTVAQLVELYSKEGLIILKGKRQGEAMKPTTAAYTKARLAHHVVPLLGKRLVTEITPGDVVRFTKDVTAGKTAKDEKKEGSRVRVIVRGGEGAARKVVRDLSAVFTFAIQHRIVSENPVATASVRKTDNKRERYLSLEEIKRLGEALDALEGEGVNAKAVNIARLWALSGCRRNEIAALQWHEVDLKRGLLTFADSKTGRNVRPIGTASVALLRALRPEKAEGYVFPAERGEGFYQGTKKVWPEVIKRAKLPGVTPHVLRHTLGSAAASGGEALLMVGAILGHANARSTQIYAHIDYDPARLAADRATAGIAAALAGGKPAATEAATPDLTAIAAAIAEGRIPAELLEALAAAAGGATVEP